MMAVLLHFQAEKSPIALSEAFVLMFFVYIPAQSAHELSNEKFDTQVQTVHILAEMQNFVIIVFS
jgi:hypothetical protein